jgi:hypothetical protein
MSRTWRAALYLTFTFALQLGVAGGFAYLRYC